MTFDPELFASQAEADAHAAEFRERARAMASGSPAPKPRRTRSGPSPSAVTRRAAKARVYEMLAVTAEDFGTDDLEEEFGMSATAIASLQREVTHELRRRADRLS